VNPPYCLKRECLASEKCTFFKLGQKETRGFLTTVAFPFAGDLLKSRLMNNLLLELPRSERPREKLHHLGPESLTDAELLAIFIRTGVKGKNAIGVARDLLKERGGLVRLARSSAVELTKAAPGIGPAKAAELLAAFELARRVAQGGEDRPQLDNPQALYEFLAPDLQHLNQETLRVVLLDTRLRLIRMEEVSLGSLNETVAHPRELLRPVLLHSAYAFVLAHNHPSGDPMPSEADRRLTRRIVEAAELLQLRLVDHIIIGTAEGGRQPYFSFRESGLM
jgi:DNA repair protein RadC